MSDTPTRWEASYDEQPRYLVLCLTCKVALGMTTSREVLDDGAHCRPCLEGNLRLGGCERSGSLWQASIFENDAQIGDRLVCVVYGMSRAVVLDRATRIIRSAQDEIDRGNKP